MKPRSIRAHLVRLVAVAVTPVILFSAALAAWNVLITRHAVETGLQDTARALSLALDREIASWIGALRALATSPALEAGDIDAFRRQAAELAARYGGSITMIAPDGHQVFTTREPAGAVLPRAAGQYFPRVFADAEPVVSNLFESALTGEPIVAVYVPVLRDGRARYAVSLALTPQRLSELLARQQLPPEGLGMVTDARNRIIARAREHEAFVGRDAPDWFAAGVQPGVDGLLEGRSFAGEALTLAFQRLPESGWTVAVAVPRSQLAAEWRTPLLAALGAGALLLVLAVGLSLREARVIGDSVRGLIDGAGQDPHPIAEIEQARRLLAAQAEERERRKEAEAAAASAEEANRSKERFLATLSHELRTPLSAIIGWIAVIRARGDDPAKVTQALGIIERNAALQAKLIDDLLDVSRIVSGKLEVRREPTDLSAAVKEALDAARPAAQEKEIALEAAVQPGLHVDGDHVRLVQIANNLLSNAIKFTPKGGRVEVALARAAAGTAELSVSDTGRGIVATLLPRIFDRFAQPAAQGGYQPGLGLGLAIVRYLAELHGGGVRAESAGPGKGAMFTVRLPLRLPEEAQRAERARAAPATALPGLRILVVDDHEDGRQWLTALLSARGATIAEASNAGEALARLPAFDPAVIVSDLAMPGGDGYDLIRALRARETGHRTPAIAFTALANGTDHARALREGFDAVILKGAGPDAVVSAIARLLELGVAAQR